MLGGCRRRGKGRRGSLLLAPLLEVQKQLVRRQHVSPGLLQLLVPDVLVVGELLALVVSRWVGELMVRLEKREKELADSIL